MLTLLTLASMAFAAPEMSPEQQMDLLGRTAPTFEAKTFEGEQFSLEAELDSVNLYKILDAFQRVMTRLDDRDRIKHEVIAPPFTIAEEKLRMAKMAEKAETVSFESLFEACESRMHAIFSFLALLEMLQMGEVTIKIGMGTNNFWISRGETYAGKQPA